MFVLLETVQRVSQPSSVFLGFKYMFACCNVSLVEWVRRRTDRFSAIYPFYLEKICYSREVVGLLLCVWRWWCDIERDENKNLFSSTTSNVMLIIHKLSFIQFFFFFEERWKRHIYSFEKSGREIWVQYVFRASKRLGVHTTLNTYEWVKVMKFFSNYHFKHV